MFLITLLEADRRKPEVVGYLSFSGKIVVDSLYCVTERFIVRATSAIWTLFASRTTVGPWYRMEA
jgi:hypothetical protein